MAIILISVILLQWERLIVLNNEQFCEREKMQMSVRWLHPERLTLLRRGQCCARADIPTSVIYLHQERFTTQSSWLSWTMACKPISVRFVHWPRSMRSREGMLNPKNVTSIIRDFTLLHPSSAILRRLIPLSVNHWIDPWQCLDSFAPFAFEIRKQWSHSSLSLLLPIAVSSLHTLGRSRQLIKQNSESLLIENMHNIGYCTTCAKSCKRRRS